MYYGTGIPLSYKVGNDLEKAYRACAWECQKSSLSYGCRSFALDTTRPDWIACLLYSTTVQENAPGPYDPAYSGIVWMANGCYTCGQNGPPYTTTTSSTSSTTSSLWTTTSSTSSTVTTTTSSTSTSSTTSSTSSTRSSTSSSSSTTSPTSTITPGPAMRTISATTLGARSCSEDPSVQRSKICDYSGLPLPTGTRAPILAATGVSALGQREDETPQYYQCAAICGDTPGCTAWALDRNAWGADRDLDWICYVFGVGFDLETWWSEIVYSDYDDWTYSDRFEWSERECIVCEPAQANSTTSSSSTTSTTSSSTTSSSTTASRTTSSSSTITPGPSIPSISATPLGSRSCVGHEEVESTKACYYSGLPMPTGTRAPILAATGVPSTDFRQDATAQYYQCAAICGDTPGCTAWMLDRDGWAPAGGRNWTCYVMGAAFDLITWLDEVDASDYSGWYETSKYQWMDRDCISCEPAQTNSTTSSTTTSSRTTSSSSSTTTTTAGPTPTCTRVANATNPGSCGVRGFEGAPGDGGVNYGMRTAAGCAAECVVRPFSCASFMVGEEGECRLFGDKVWNVLGSLYSGRSGSAFYDYVRDDMGCWQCVGPL
jgi:hypothetical protein